MACQSEIEVLAYANPQAVFNFLCAQGRVNPFHIAYVDYYNWIIHLKCGISWESWGEKITVRVFDNQDGNTRLIIHSKSALPTTLIDWGKNRQNVQRVTVYLQNAFAILTTAPRFSL